MKKADQISGIVILLFSGLVIGESLRIPEQAVAVGRTNFAPVPGFLPFWAGVILAVFAIMLIVRATLQPAEPGKAAIFPRGWALASVALLAASVAVYIFLLEVVGYLLDTFLLNALLLRVVMRVEWKMSIAVALLASVLLYAIFQVLLGVGLPTNLFGF